MEEERRQYDEAIYFSVACHGWRYDLLLGKIVVNYEIKY